MGFLDRLLGREDQQSRSYPAGGVRQRPDYGTFEQPAPNRGRAPGHEPDPDQAAVDRYRYLLRTAPPDRIEEAHAEAFAQLTPEQRQQVLQQLGNEVPASERSASDDPRSLARMATRAEMRNPGTLERSFAGRGGMGGGMGGMGGLIAGSLLASVAGAFVGTAIADAMFDNDDSGDTQADGGDSGDQGGDSGDQGGDSGDQGGDAGDAGYDSGGGDFGGDFGGFDGGGFGDF